MSTTRTPRIAVLAILPLLLASLAGLASPAHAVAPGPELAWGDNGAGQLGDGTTTSRSTPTLVCAVGASAPCTSYLHGITAIAAGRFQSFAIATPPAADLSVGLQISEVERLGGTIP